MPREIVVDWTTISGSGKNSVFMFDLVTPVASQRSALNTFLDLVCAALDNSTSFNVRPEGRDLNNATGALEGVWANSTVHNGSGSGTSEPVSDAVQALVRWQTGQIVNGRFLNGRTFIPGLTQTLVVGGNLAAGSVTGIGTAANGLISASVGFGIWHRPVLGAGGSFALATGATVWTELAVLRRRRN